MNINDDKELGIAMGKLARLISLAKNENRNLSIGTYTQFVNILVMIDILRKSICALESKKIDIQEMVVMFNEVCEYLHNTKIKLVNENIKKGFYIGYFREKEENNE
ncbi:MAG: hypothetical protein PWR24_1131 [Desulfonauticus sp.]|nr:hypothetical protein [Desulfonauticus sp.]